MVTPAISNVLEARKRKELKWSPFFHLFESTVFRLVGMWRHLLQQNSTFHTVQSHSVHLDFYTYVVYI